jgi:ATP-dependent DNA helicase RecG
MKTETQSTGLEQSLSTLKGVGPARQRLLDSLGLETLGDLLFQLPRRLVSSGTACSILVALEDCEGGIVVISGEVTRHRFNRFGRRSTLRLTVIQGDAELEVVYFNQSWQRERFVKGASYSFAGRVTSSAKGPLMIAPKSAAGIDSLEAGRWIPVYNVVKGLGQDRMRSLLNLALEEALDEVEEPLAAELLERENLLPLPEALREVHFPRDPEQFDRARRRVVLHELLAMQMRLARDLSAGRVPLEAHRVPLLEDGQAELGLNLPFELTAGQRDLLRQFELDLAAGQPMRRLLQGDVGSGKTVLALLSMVRVVRSGGQCAFMAPTELLAEQHYGGSLGWLEAAGLRSDLLTGSMSVADRKRVLKRLAKGEIDVLFGTHALFSKSVVYRRLVFCVIDEQQRFGVAQRTRLLEKGGAAHLLLMTATPIPRTLALTIYGDLEVSVLREKPAGRGSIKTRWLRPKDGQRVPEFLLERLRANEQVYWVCPRIGAGQEVGAEASYERLVKSPLGAFGMALVHGQLPSQERSDQLDAFRRGEVKMLVATTVIEVGLDVSAATVMVIEEAERLGLAQLHQLRGRVGRGTRPSWCLLYGKPAAAERFETLERCADGFEIAEEDLRQRGMGELAGLRQSGEWGATSASLEDDLDLLLLARELVHGPSPAGASLRASGQPAP